MALSTKKLLSYLRAENITFQYYGSEFEDIYYIAELPDISAFHLQENTVYISSDVSLASYVKGWNILFTSPENEALLLHLCTTCLIWHQKKESLLLKFYEELNCSPNYTGLLRTCSAIFDGNPVILLNDRLVPRIHSDNLSINMDDSFIKNLKHIIQTGGPHPFIQAESSSACPFPVLIRKIERKNSKTEYLCIIEQTSSPHIADLIQYFDDICCALARYGEFIALRSGEPETALDKLMLDLLLNEPDSPSAARIQLGEAGFKEAEAYYVLSIDKQYNSSALPDLAKIRKILHTDHLYEYSHYIVAVLKYPYLAEIADTCLTELSGYLTRYDLYAGISNCFFDITALNSFFTQSTKAIELSRFCNFSKEPRISKYIDFTITHFTEIISQSSNIKIIDLCHPTLLYMLKYDEKNNTDYTNTLSAYILSNRSITLSAAALCIHRNTLYNRITKIREIFHLDLDDVTLVAQLYLSVNMLGSLKLIDSNIWLRIHYEPFQ